MTDPTKPAAPSDFETWMREHPFMAIALGYAIGHALGYLPPLFRRSKRKDR